MASCPNRNRPTNSSDEPEAKELVPAEQFFQANGDRLKDLRNEFGGHLQAESVKFATAHLSDVIGSITFHSAVKGWSLGLECGFAVNIVTGVISYTMKGKGDYKQELKEAWETLGSGFKHAQAATAALVVMFLWDRFGG